MVKYLLFKQQSNYYKLSMNFVTKIIYLPSLNIDLPYRNIPLLSIFCLSITNKIDE